MSRYCGIRFQQETERAIFTAWFVGLSEKSIREDLASKDGWKDLIAHPDTKSELLSEEQLKKETSYGLEAAIKAFRGGAGWVGDHHAKKIMA